MWHSLPWYLYWISFPISFCIFSFEEQEAVPYCSPFFSLPFLPASYLQVWGTGSSRFEVFFHGDNCLHFRYQVCQEWKTYIKSWLHDPQGSFVILNEVSVSMKASANSLLIYILNFSGRKIKLLQMHDIWKLNYGVLNMLTVFNWFKNSV